MTHRTVRLAIIVQVMAMAMFFCTLMLIQPVYAQVYGRAETFPYWFGAVAVIAGTSSILNALLVERLGMRRLVRLTLFGQILLSGFMYFSGLASAGGVLGFGAFLFWQLCLFAQAGLTLGNLNAIAMEPMGHMAGMAASVIGSVSTILAALIASPVALMFADDVSLLFGSVLLMACAAWGLMLLLTRSEVDLAAPAE
jgi:DHA1 family bicyclomycin/chloramphenicol resistance-like MFS transporter